MAKSEALLAVCSLANPSGEGCAWCGAALPKRRRTWCSDRCSGAFWTNHWWTLARRAAKKRDRYRCTRCGERAPKRNSPDWRLLRKTKRVEVNHIVQARGAHVRLSCLHHLTNLETLCVTCHKEQTKRQAAARRQAS
jgi:5-methylcytosine-specific restriction endonuclease McrA